MPQDDLIARLTLMANQSDYGCWPDPDNIYRCAATALASRAAEIEALRAALRLCGDIFDDMFRTGFAYSPVGKEAMPPGAYFIGPGVRPAIRAALQEPSR